MLSGSLLLPVPDGAEITFIFAVLDAISLIHENLPWTVFALRWHERYAVDETGAISFSWQGRFRLQRASWDDLQSRSLWPLGMLIGGLRSAIDWFIWILGCEPRTAFFLWSNKLHHFLITSLHSWFIRVNLFCFCFIAFYSCATLIVVSLLIFFGWLYNDG